MTYLSFSKSVCVASICVLVSTSASEQNPPDLSPPPPSPSPSPLKEPSEALALPSLMPPGTPKAKPPNDDSNDALWVSGSQRSSGLPSLPSDGFWIESSPINELFQYLARACNFQFFNNNELNDPKYQVTGHLQLTDPRKQMDELAIAHGLTVYTQGNTLHLMTEQQVARLPVECLSYPLRYLRGAGTSKTSTSSGEGGAAPVAEFEKLKAIIRPMLTRDVGLIEFEDKTNTLLVTDNEVKLKRIRDVLQVLDRPKKQIAINVRILRVRNSRGSNIGIDWSGALGGAGGVPINVSQSLNALFNLPDAVTLAAGGTVVANNGQGIVFDSVKAQAIVRALQEKELVTQESCPTVITEDNEQGIISFVDRFPVITSTVTATSAGQSVTDKVRYKIDEEDASSVDKPDKSREIGVTLSVTPTLLPDGTVRMRLRPRVANVVEVITGKSGNSFPRVSESTIEGISRIPSGQSLFLGGFYDSSDKRGGKKIPLLGSIPLVGMLFGSKSKAAEQVSLVFIITPSVYDALNTDELGVQNTLTRMSSGFNQTQLLASRTPTPPATLSQKGALPAASVPPKAGISANVIKAVKTSGAAGNPPPLVAPEPARPRWVNRHP